MKMLQRWRRRLRTGPPQNQLIAQYVGGTRHQIHKIHQTPDTQNFDSVAVVAFGKIKDCGLRPTLVFCEDKTIVICGYKLYHCEFY